jgi:hypothetical protein
MADGISFRMITDPFTEGITLRQKKMPRAAMWAVREAGRQVRKAEQAKAPVMKGGGPSAKTLSGLNRRKGFTVKSDAYGRPVPGLLRASIASSKNLKQLGASSFSLKVGPRGPRVHLYAQKAEAKHGYVAAGEAVAKDALAAVAAAAFARVWKE